MELKVWVDGLQRVVCGLADRTTCQEVIYALAHATGKTGRFVLVEKWRTSERSLSPHDRPLELLSKWGEYAGDVQFVLRCLEETTGAAAHHNRRQQQQQKLLDDNNQSAHNNSRHHNHQNQPARFQQTEKSRKAVGDSTSTSTVKPYFVDTSNPTPESGTLLRPTMAGRRTFSPPPTSVQQQQQNAYRMQMQRNLYSPPPTASANGHLHYYHHHHQRFQPQQLQLQQQPMSQQFDMQHPRRAQQLQQQQGGSLTVLSQSVHETLSDLNVRRVDAEHSSVDKSLLETSYSSTQTSAAVDVSVANSSFSAMQQQNHQHDLSQTSVYSSASNSSANNGVPVKSKNFRPPPPSYDSFLQSRHHHQHNARSQQSSPAPFLATNNANRSRTPVAGLATVASGFSPPNKLNPQPQQPLTREQLIKLVADQNNHLRAQGNTLRAFDAEIQQREESQRQFLGSLENTRKELQKLQVERVHIKQKIEELRRQDLETQLSNLRKNTALAAAETTHIRELKLAPTEQQLSADEQAIRQLSADVERERRELNLMSSSSTGDFTSSLSSLNESTDLDTEAIEARIRALDEMLMAKKRHLDDLNMEDRSETALVRTGFVQLNNSDEKNTLLKQQEITPGVWV